MPNVTNPQCFIGEYDLGSNCYDDEVLISFIQQYEKVALDEIMGCELRIDFLNDLDVNGQPQSDRWIDIFQEQVFNDGCRVCFIGIKDMLVRYVYVKYMTRREARPTNGGTRRTDSENSSVSPYIYATLASIHNEYADNANILKQHLRQNKDVYPEYIEFPYGYYGWYNYFYRIKGMSY